MAVKKTLNRKEVIDILGSALYQMRNHQAKAAELKADLEKTRMRAVSKYDILHALNCGQTIEALKAETEAYSMASANIEVAARHLDIEDAVMEKAAS